LLDIAVAAVIIVAVVVAAVVVDVAVIVAAAALLVQLLSPCSVRHSHSLESQQCHSPVFI